MMTDWNLIDSYFNNNKYYFTKHHLDSYNDFIRNKIPHTINSLNPFVIQKDKAEINIYVAGMNGDEIFFEKPSFDNNTLYPNVAYRRSLRVLFGRHREVEVSLGAPTFKWCK